VRVAGALIPAVGAGSLTIAGASLVAVHDWTFLLGPGFCVGVNGLLLGYLFYRSGLVPRWTPERARAPGVRSWLRSSRRQRQGVALALGHPTTY
jgi:hypothetical protein